jgi:hypothetical protein
MIHWQTKAVYLVAAAASLAAVLGWAFEPFGCAW